MNASLRYIYALALLTAAAAVAQTPMLPCDGDVVAVDLVDADMVCDSGRVWRFDGADRLASGVEFRYAFISDSVWSETRPGVRRDYGLRGDTVVWLVTETRDTRIDHHGFAPWLAPGYPGASASVTESGRHEQWLLIEGAGRAEVAPAVCGTLVLDDQCTIGGALLVERVYRVRRTGRDPQSADTCSLPSDSVPVTTERVRSWYAPGVRYPVAETRSVTDSLAGEELWRSTLAFVSPPETQPLDHAGPARTQAPGRGGAMSLPPSPLQPSSPVIRTAVDGRMVTVAPGEGISSTETDYSPLRIIITDVQGRVWLSGLMPQTGTLSLDCAALPPGQYIVAAISEGAAVSSAAIRID